MYVNKRTFDEVLENFIDGLNPIPLGQSYTTLDGDSCAINLALYRCQKKYSKPSQSDSERARKSVAAMLAYDASGYISFQPARMDMDSEVRKVIYQARDYLHKVLSDFKFDTNLLDFPSGESYDSARGDVSLFAKLKNLVHWRVTPDCFDLFARVVYNTISLKRIAKSHMGQCRNNHDMWLHYKDQKDFAFCIFREKLRTIVTFSYGSRLATVPKDKDVDRVIEVECMGNMIVQRTIGNGIRQVLKQRFNVDLEQAQLVHRKMISNPEYATIDLSNASNSNWLHVIKFFVPNRLFSLLSRSRAAVVSYEGEYYGLNMLSPMGNGFTFEVMTLVLLAMCRTLDSTSRVYGDDIIIKNSSAHTLIETLKLCGYQTNIKKTFINSHFRESCGAFYHDDYGYITAYDFHYPTNDFDRMVLINKVWNLGNHFEMFKKLHSSLLQLFDSSALRSRDTLCPASIHNNAFLTEGVICSSAQQRRQQTRKPTSISKLIAKLMDSPRVDDILTNLQYRKKDIRACWVPELHTSSYKSRPTHLAGRHKWVWYGFYLRSGVITPKIRRTTERKTVKLIVSSTFL